MIIPKRHRTPPSFSFSALPRRFPFTHSPSVFLQQLLSLRTTFICSRDRFQRYRERLVTRKKNWGVLIDAIDTPARCPNFPKLTSAGKWRPWAAEPASVFQKLTRHIILRTGSLRVITYTKQGFMKRRPSWVTL